MLRRLHPEQPASFAFTPANLEWAQGQITKYPAGRQASAVIPLLWRAQEQEGWLSKPAIEAVAEMLGMAYIRVLEVATFYFMFQLQPVGSVANIQICGTTSCMICGAEDLISVCKELIAPAPHTVSEDGKFSWEEVECLGACSNAPMAQIGKDYYEDLTPEKLRALITRFRAGEVPVPGPQNGRYSSEPATGLTSLAEFDKDRAAYNASVQRAVDIGETVKRIDGTEVPLNLSWLRNSDQQDAPEENAPAAPSAAEEAAAKGMDEGKAEALAKGKPETEAAPAAPAVAQPGQPVAGDEAPSAAAGTPAPEKTAPEKAAPAKAAEPAAAAAAAPGQQPQGLAAARDGAADDLKIIEGIGPALEKLLNDLGFYHFDQIAAWSEEEIAWVDQNLKGFKGRVTRDKWVSQAGLIVREGPEAFRLRAKTNDY